MTAFEHKFVRLEDTETSEGFEQDGDRQVQRDWEAIRAWEQERTELLHRIRQSMAVHLEIENRQQQILQRAKCYQQLMVQSPEHGEQWLLHLHELNHEFKQADLMIEHEAMKLHFLQRHYNTIAMLLVDFVEQSNVAAQAFAAPLDRPWDTQEAVQDSPSKASWLNEPPLPDYVEPRRLRSRPYPFLVRTGLQMSQLCWGAIAICVLVYGLLAAASGGSEPGVIAIAFGEFAIRFCSHFLIGTVAFWGFTALWESSR